MASSAELIRSFRGPALLSYGFRPFFLFGATWGALAVALWPAVLTGSITLPTAFDPVRWHAHELIYGYVPAIITGFLLTAVPNWTGRLPVVGARLLALVALWMAGRIAILFSAEIGPALAAAIDLSFLAALSAIIAREVVAGRNTRNLKVVAVLGVLFAGNAISHAELLFATHSGYGQRIGIAAILMLIALIGGRIIPSFTRNWLVRARPRSFAAALCWLRSFRPARYRGGADSMDHRARGGTDVSGCMCGGWSSCLEAVAMGG